MRYPRTNEPRTNEASLASCIYVRLPVCTDAHTIQKNTARTYFSPEFRCISSTFCDEYTCHLNLRVHVFHDIRHYFAHAFAVSIWCSVFSTTAASICFFVFPTQFGLSRLNLCFVVVTCGLIGWAGGSTLMVISYNVVWPVSTPILFFQVHVELAQPETAQIRRLNVTPCIFAHIPSQCHLSFSNWASSKSSWAGSTRLAQLKRSSSADLFPNSELNRLKLFFSGPTSSWASSTRIFFPRVELSRFNTSEFLRK